ncbi:unnamed protein product [Rhodiola kirilowii]
MTMTPLVQCLTFLLLFILPQHASLLQQLHPSQSQTLLTIQELLNHYPPHWTAETDLCNSEGPNSVSTVVCFQGNVTQLYISGATFNHTLSPNFSSESLFGALGTLTHLKVLSLVSLGLWGPLPGNIGALTSLEILNLSSNNFNGGIPVDISSVKTLQTLILDHNLFTGKLPKWLGTLPLLSHLSLKHNYFRGQLPRALSRMRSLRVLALSSNRFYGEVPDLRSSSNLQLIDLEGNFLGPTFPKLSNKLVSIVLRRNRFRLNIPANVTSFYQLQTLDVSLNAFVGPFDPKLLSLPSLTHLDVSRNKLTGLLFRNMSCNPDLVFVNMSSNRLTGDVPECLRRRNSRTQNVSYSDNCLASRDSKQFPRSFCSLQALAVDIPVVGRHSRKHVHSKRALVVALSVIATAGVGLAALGLMFVITRRLYISKKVEEPKTRWIKENFSTVNTAKQLLDAKHITEMMKLGSRRLQAYRPFSLEELTEATNSFESSALVGEGYHGQVYRGKLADGTPVAIRTLQMRRKQNAQSYTHHFEILAKLRHCHLVSAIGHCLECYPDESSISKIHLVFEFMSNGTLRHFISGQKLNWVQRMAAAIGITKGMLFLHTGFAPGIYSSNLKIEDVLVDHDFHAKISNYNLPLFTEIRNIKMERSASGKSSSNKQRKNDEDKSDIYSLGTILLEILVGRPIETGDDVAVSRDILQVSLKSDDKARRSIVDPAIHKEPTDESLRTFISICVKCLSIEPEIRPSVEDVLWNLQFAAQIEESWKVNSPIVY